jgi:hypothetical protein
MTRNALPYENVGANQKCHRKNASSERSLVNGNTAMQELSGRRARRVRFNRANLLKLLLSEVDSFDRSR